MRGTVPTVHTTTRSPDGKLMAADFETASRCFRGLNSGPQFPHTEAFSSFLCATG